MIDKAIFIDTNILIYSNLALSPFHTQAIQKLQDFANQDIEITRFC
jgi:predicted nucleic acid-binding protein